MAFGPLHICVVSLVRNTFEAAAYVPNKVDEYLCTSGLTAWAVSASSFRGGVDKPRDPRPLRLLLAAAVPPVWLGPAWCGQKVVQ